MIYAVIIEVWKNVLIISILQFLQLPRGCEIQHSSRGPQTSLLNVPLFSIYKKILVNSPNK